MNTLPPFEAQMSISIWFTECHQCSSLVHGWASFSEHSIFDVILKSVTQTVRQTCHLDYLSEQMNLQLQLFHLDPRPNDKR